MTGPIGLHIALQIHQSLFHGVHIRISRILAGIHGGGPDCGVIFVFQRHHASILGVPQSRPTGDLVSDHICIVEQRGGAPDPWHTDDAAVAVLYLVNAAEVLSQVVVVLQLTGVNGFQNTGIQILLQIQGEPEVAFNDINDNMDLAEEFIKYCVQWALDNCYDDVKFLNDMFDKGLIERLQGVLKEEFVRLPYTEGIKILEDAVAKGHKFEFPVYWGVDLASEHERYLVEEHFKRPVILTDYPKEIKAFYMKQNEDGKTVRAMDVLFPKIGEIIGGSEREADYDKLLTRIQELNIPMKDMWWYLDTRKYGSCPHSGFGLGFERLLLFVTGMANIRDVIPFPRTPRNAEF